MNSIKSLQQPKSLLAMCVAAAVSFPSVSQATILEEVIVTATKRAESVQDIGISVQAFDEELLKQGGITDVSRIESLVSGVNYAFVGNDAKFNVRGANSTNTFGDNTSIVGAFVDGVYKPRASQQTRAFYDIERVEFLKGPQGTLYGRNTFAGALNLHTKAPSFEDGFSGDVEVSLESYDRVGLSGAINLPVNDKLAFRIAASADKSDGYIENLAGDDIGAQDDKSIRVSAKYLASDSVDWTLRIQHSEEDGREAGLFGNTFLCRREATNGLTDPFGPVRNCANPNRGSGGFPNVDGFDGYTISQDYVPEVDLVEDVIALEGNFDFGSYSVKSITSYTDFQNLMGFDFDYSPNPNQVGGYDETLESFSQEFNLSTNLDGPLNLTAGLYYADDETSTSFSIFQETVRDDSVRGTAIAPNGAALTVLSGTPLVSRDASLGGFFADHDIIESEALGIFSRIEWDVSERLSINLGLRYSEEDKALRGGGSNFTGDTNGDGIVDPVVSVLPGVAGSSPAVIPDSRDVFSINPNASDAISGNTTSVTNADGTIRRFAEKYDNFSYRIGFELDVGDDDLVYATASTGFLSGAISRGNGATEEQESEMIEIGYKGFLLDNTLKLNAALHFTEYTNLLTQTQRPVGDIVVTESRNGGDIEAKGLEIEAVYVPNDKLTLGANIAFLDSEYGTFGTSNPYQLFNGQVVPFLNLDGQTTPWSPDTTITLTASYRFDLGSNGSLTPYIQVYSSDEYFTSNTFGLDPNQLQDSFTKTDIRLTWEDVDGKYSVEAFVENIEDEAVLARGNNNGDDLVQTGFLFPRNAGIRLRAKF